MASQLENVLTLSCQSAGRSESASAIQRVSLVSVDDEGRVLVRTESGTEVLCDWLETGSVALLPLNPGDQLIALFSLTLDQGVVLGRVGRYHPAKPLPTVTIEAGESLSLKCGETSIDLRADGNVLVRGENVTLRAKGTQRIRAGTVSIN